MFARSVPGDQGTRSRRRFTLLLRAWIIEFKFRRCVDETLGRSVRMHGKNKKTQLIFDKRGNERMCHYGLD